MEELLLFGDIIVLWGTKGDHYYWVRALREALQVIEGWLVSVQRCASSLHGSQLGFYLAFFPSLSMCAEWTALSCIYMYYWFKNKTNCPQHRSWAKFLKNTECQYDLRFWGLHWVNNIVAIHLPYNFCGTGKCSQLTRCMLKGHSYVKFPVHGNLWICLACIPAMYTKYGIILA